MNTISRPLSELVTLGCLAALMLVLPWWLSDNAPSFGLIGALSGAVVPVLLLFAVYTRIRNWSGITALCMIPFTVVGVMDVIANLADPTQGLLIALLSIIAFLCVLDAGRRTL